jgi:5-methyltetrahydrofolate--homocysteine methyltransferase
MDVLARISESLEQGDNEMVAGLIRQALATGLPAADILERGLLAGMTRVGERFRRHEIFLPEMLLSAKAMHAGLDLVKPLLAREGVPLLGKVVLGTVRGDLHDIGKNLVGVMLRAGGLEVIDLGHDVASERFVETALAEQAPVIGLSALLTTTMSRMKEVVELVRARGFEDRIKIIVGGAPVSTEFARAIGADAYGYDAANAVERVKELLGVDSAHRT